MRVMHREYWEYHPGLRWFRRCLIIALICTGFGFGIGSLVSWIWPPMTATQAYNDGYADGISNGTTTQWPFGKWTCVSDWNAEVTGFAQSKSDVYAVDGGLYAIGFAQGGPPATHLISMSNQDTGTALGNDWMRGCRTGLAYALRH